MKKMLIVGLILAATATAFAVLPIYDAGGTVIKGVAAGVASTDAVNVAQLNAAAFGGSGGSISCGQLPALSGGVTSSAGSCVTTAASVPSSAISDSTTVGRSMLTAASAAAQAALWGTSLPTLGTDIPDANTTISISGGSSYKMPTATAARVVTLGTSGSPLTNEAIRVNVTRTSAFAITIQDDASTSLIVVPASVKGTVVANYSGTHFAAPVFVRTQ